MPLENCNNLLTCLFSRMQDKPAERGAEIHWDWQANGAGLRGLRLPAGIRRHRNNRHITVFAALQQTPMKPAFRRERQTAATTPKKPCYPGKNTFSEINVSGAIAMKNPAVLAVLSLTALLAHPALLMAQSSPDSDSIIRSLRPSSSDVGTFTRGIRPAAPSGVSPVERSSAPAHARGAPSVKLMVDFRTGSAELTPAAEHTLDQLGRALSSQALASFRFRIEGHTDTVGSPEVNKTLSAKRADAVSAYLQTRFAIDSARLEPAGLGSSELVVQTPDQTPEPRNRVVRVVNLGS